MQSSDYWAQRALQREAEAFKDTADAIRRLRAIYDRAGKRLSDAAKNIFTNYLTASGGIDADKARALLSAQESAALLDQLRQEYLKTDDAEALAKLNAPSYAYRISRVQALRKIVEAETASLAEQERRIGEMQLVKAYDDGYYKTMYDAAQANGDVSFAALPSKAVAEAVENKWKGKNYSQRVWENTEVVAQEAGKIIDSGITAGSGVYKMAYELQDLLNAGAYASERLIRTETNRMHNDATRTAYGTMGVEAYRYLATLDARTCAVCGALDGKHFKVSDAKTGVNFPPMHPNDRCTTVAYDPDEKLDGVRLARDPKTGRNYKVSQGMTYTEWRAEIDQKYGAGTLKKAQKMVANRKSDAAQLAEMRKILGKDAMDNVADFQNLKYNEPDRYRVLKNALPVVKELKSQGIKGRVHIPPKEIDPETLDFDAEHINTEREHGVAEAEAKGFIRTADISITKWKGQYENYYSKDGAAYVNIEGQYIRTAYHSSQFDGDAKLIREVMDKHAKGHVPPAGKGN